jgi:hypothetical protein
MAAVSVFCSVSFPLVIIRETPRPGMSCILRPSLKNFQKWLIFSNFTGGSRLRNTER